MPGNWVLIVVIEAMGLTTPNSGRGYDGVVPAATVSFQEFSTKERCEAARSAIIKRGVTTSCKEK